MFLSLDGTFWIQMLNFAIFFAILNVVFLRPVGEAIRKRRAHIDGVVSDYERSAGELKTLRAQTEAKRAEARRAASETFTAARAQAATEAEAILADYGARGAALVHDARATVAAEVEQARRQEPALAQSLADAMLERAMGVVAR